MKGITDCFKYCRSLKCFNAHKKTRKSKGIELPSRCETSFKCHECQSVVERTRQDEHRCDEFKCDICKTFVLPGHLCFMQLEEPKKPNDKYDNIDRRLVPYHAKSMRIQSRIEFIYIFICINYGPFCDGVRRLGTG